MQMIVSTWSGMAWAGEFHAPYVGVTPSMGLQAVV
jgi:hypothetical protein